MRCPGCSSAEGSIACGDDSRRRRLAPVVAHGQRVIAERQVGQSQRVAREAPSHDLAVLADRAGTERERALVALPLLAEHGPFERAGAAFRAGHQNLARRALDQHRHRFEQPAPARRLGGVQMILDLRRGLDAVAHGGEQLRHRLVRDLALDAPDVPIAGLDAGQGGEARLEGRSGHSLSVVEMKKLAECGGACSALPSPAVA